MIFKSLKYKKYSFYAYDWANSPFSTIIITFIFAEYFIKVLAKDIISGTSLWGWMISLSSIMVALSGPILGIIADKKNNNDHLLLVSSLLVCLFSSLLWFANPNTINIYIFLIIIGLANFFFETSMIFYNSRLKFFSGEKIGRLSGTAWSIGYLGGIASLSLVLFLLVLPDIPIFNFDKNSYSHIRICGPFVATWFIIFGLPFLLIKTEKTKCINSSIRNELKKFLQKLLIILKKPTVGRFLISRMFYTDGLNTLFAFGGIYAAGTFGLNFKEIILFGIAINVSAALGAYILGFFDDYFGSKNTILLSLFFLIMLSLIILFIQTVFWFWIIGLSLGFFIGSVQSSSRALMIKFSPKSQINEMFGFYALSGKSTAFIGPFLVATITSITNNQRYGMSCILIFLIVGLILLYFTKSNSIPND